MKEMAFSIENVHMLDIFFCFLFFFKAPYNTLTFDIIGDAAAQEFFDIRADTGAIVVQKSLALTSQTSFRVGVLN